jgi:hypothetical protein
MAIAPGAGQQQVHRQGKTWPDNAAKLKTNTGAKAEIALSFRLVWVVVPEVKVVSVQRRSYHWPPPTTRNAVVDGITPLAPTNSTPANTGPQTRPQTPPRHHHGWSQYPTQPLAARCHQNSAGRSDPYPSQNCRQFQSVHVGLFVHGPSGRGPGRSGCFSAGRRRRRRRFQDLIGQGCSRRQRRSQANDCGQPRQQAPCADR